MAHDSRDTLPDPLQAPLTDAQIRSARNFLTSFETTTAMLRALSAAAAAETDSTTSAILEGAASLMARHETETL